MEMVVFFVAVFLGLVFLMRKGRSGGSGPDEYVHNAKALPDELATTRAGHFPGPGGPIKGAGGGNVSGGG